MTLKKPSDSNKNKLVLAFSSPLTSGEIMAGLKYIPSIQTYAHGDF